jgi:hypothetical protein
MTRSTSRLTVGALLDARLERDEFVGPGADWRLPERLLADLLDVVLRNDPPSAGIGRVKRQEVGPRRAQAEHDASGVGHLDRGDPVLHQLVRRAAVALERELHILGGQRVAIVKFDPFAQHELVALAVLRGDDRLGQARGEALPRHRFDHRVMQRIKHHERRDDAGRFGRIEPHRRERNMHAPGQLAVRSCGNRRARGAGDQAKRGKGEEVAASYAGSVRIGGRLVVKRRHLLLQPRPLYY